MLPSVYCVLLCGFVNYTITRGGGKRITPTWFIYTNQPGTDPGRSVCLCVAVAIAVVVGSSSSTIIIQEEIGHTVS